MYNPTARATIDEVDAWKLFTKSIEQDEIKSKVRECSTGSSAWTMQGRMRQYNLWTAWPFTVQMATLLPTRLCLLGQDEPRWSRQQLAEWLVDQLRDQESRTVVGIDHGFSFPVEYFDLHQLPKRDWDQFLVDFRNHWPTHREWVRTAGGVGRGRLTNAHVLNHPRHGDHTWKRLTEELTLSASSVFNFNARQRTCCSLDACWPSLVAARPPIGERFAAACPLLAVRWVADP